MKNCTICYSELKFGNTPPFSSGKLSDGSVVCTPCWRNIKNKDSKIAINLKKYSLVDIKNLLEIKITEKKPELGVTEFELSAIQKLQFRKYISEQSGMNLQEVEIYLSTISHTENEELIKNFKNEDNGKVETKIIPTIQIINDDSDKPTCPKCNSKQVTFNKQGFGFGKALVGGVLTGGIGLFAGGINKNKIILTCLKCGKTWNP